jgi:hypothetical protein
LASCSISFADIKHCFLEKPSSGLLGTYIVVS